MSRPADALEYGVEWGGYWFRHLKDARYVWTRRIGDALRVRRMVAAAVVVNLPRTYRDEARVAWLPAH